MNTLNAMKRLQYWVKVHLIFLGLVLTLVMAVVTAEYIVCPIYSFSEPQPFSGTRIYNPYQGLDSSKWVKANFHCHTLHSDGYNKLQDVQDAYRKYGFEVLAVSDHNIVLNQGLDKDYEIPTYEHGINLAKFHSIIIGAKHGNIFDFVPYYTESQRYWMLKWLSSKGGIVVFDHPDRTRWLYPHHMRYLSFYSMMEVERAFHNGHLSYYDTALSCGHYSYVLASDDCHDVRMERRFCRTASFVNISSKRSRDVLRALNGGGVYAVTMPHFNDSVQKLWRNLHLPKLKYLEYRNDSVSIAVTEPATINIFGQNGVLKYSFKRCTNAAVPFKKEDTYLRFVAIFQDSVFLYTSPVARYNGASFPQTQNLAEVNYPLTILMWLAVAALTIFWGWLFVRIMRTMPPLQIPSKGTIVKKERPDKLLPVSKVV